jgi:hypothetical protein
MPIGGERKPLGKVDKRQVRDYLPVFPVSLRISGAAPWRA